jgi:hypothetical protein
VPGKKLLAGAFRARSDLGWSLSRNRVATEMHYDAPSTAA